MKSNTILLSLNEINFDFISFYIDKGMLPNFNKLFKIQKPIETTSEDEYHLLEPWIQWVSVNTGKSFSEHNIFRLGDIEDNPKLLQIFEEIEMKGYKVGAISPFNTNNKLKNPAFFIPDPWTNTIVSGNWLIKLLYKAIRQAVNDNASEKLNFVSLISLALGFLYSVPINRWSHYVKLIFRLKKPASKAIIFDSLLTDLFFKLSDKHNTDFSNLFLNAGAHIQHHYFFNSKAYKGSFTNPNWYCPTDYDPLLKILIEYDNTIGRILKKTNTKLLVATGLHQVPHEKTTYYWRIKNHNNFIKILGINDFTSVIPRMSRDFLIKFKDYNHANYAENILNSFYDTKNNLKIFSVNNRKDSLFVEFIYSKDISEFDTMYSKINDLKYTLKPHLSFISIKNGEHNGVGYLTSNFDLESADRIPLTDVNLLIKKSVFLN